MPESVPHDEILQLLKLILAVWCEKHGGFVARNLAFRWDKTRPRNGTDPDVAVYVPPPPGAEMLKSIRTWEPGFAAPQLAIEVVSEADPRKDYEIALEKYAVCDVDEVWIFDPLLVGPKKRGGPYRLQLWLRNEKGELTRTHAGPGPAFSPFLKAWIVPTEEGRRLRIADDEAAASVWLTAAEEASRAREAERAAKDAALARVAELEALLAKRS